MTVQPSSQRGVTLIELILSMVIISFSLVGIFSVINLTIKHSADPMVISQAIAVAESYMDEVLLRAYSDPNGSNTGETRSSFDNVDDYNGLNDVGAHNQEGHPIVNLSRFSIAIAVSAPLTLTGGVPAKKISVTVTGIGMPALNLVSYKTDY